MRDAVLLLCMIVERELTKETGVGKGHWIFFKKTCCMLYIMSFLLSLEIVISLVYLFPSCNWIWTVQFQTVLVELDYGTVQLPLWLPLIISSSKYYLYHCVFYKFWVTFYKFWVHLRCMPFHIWETYKCIVCILTIFLA